MKQHTNTIQTMRLQDLGFPSPKSVSKLSLDLDLDMDYIFSFNYSIGELIEMLEEVASVVISYSYQKRGYYVRVIIPKRIGGGMYRISQIELVDALYDMIIRLKEEGKI